MRLSTSRTIVQERGARGDRQPRSDGVSFSGSGLRNVLAAEGPEFVGRTLALGRWNHTRPGGESVNERF
jgi:hypothetical protein